MCQFSGKQKKEERVKELKREWNRTSVSSASYVSRSCFSIPDHACYHLVVLSRIHALLILL